MKCKHCGKELVAITLYVEVGALGGAGLAAAPAVASFTYHPTFTYHPISEGETIFFPNAAAATPYVPLTVNSCYHEPAIEVPDTTGGNSR